MVEDKIKLGYLVATAELRIDEKVTAYQGGMETAFHKLSELGYDVTELMILDPDFVERDRVEQLSREYGIEIPVLCTGEVYGQGALSFMDPDQWKEASTMQSLILPISMCVIQTGSPREGVI
jgi:hypothetical protein